MAETDTAPNSENSDAQPPTKPGTVVAPNDAQLQTPFAQSSEAAAPFAATPDPASTPEDKPGTITWTASEFIAHEKGIGWYAGLAVVAVIFAALIYVITKDRVSSGVVLAAASLLGIYSTHKPRQLEYRLDHRGITVGGRHFPYEGFRSFSIIPEGAFSSIVFMPMKRFALPLTLYHAPDDEAGIVNILSDQLPLEQRRPDAIDSLMRRIRF